MSSSQLLSLDFDDKASSYMDFMDATLPYMENGLEYLQYPPQSPPFELPSFEISALPATTTSPLPYNRALTLSGESTCSSSPPVTRSHRFNPIGVAANRPALQARNRDGKTIDEATNEDGNKESHPLPPPPCDNNARRNVITKQRIESEQRRRDELRNGYARLKETLPASSQKLSKVSLLDRATSHILDLEMRLKAAESEVHRLRGLNETLMCDPAAQRQIASTATPPIPITQ